MVQLVSVGVLLATAQSIVHCWMIWHCLYLDKQKVWEATTFCTHQLRNQQWERNSKGQRRARKSTERCRGQQTACEALIMNRLRQEQMTWRRERSCQTYFNVFLHINSKGSSGGKPEGVNPFCHTCQFPPWSSRLPHRSSFPFCLGLSHFKRGGVIQRKDTRRRRLCLSDVIWSNVSFWRRHSRITHQSPSAALWCLLFSSLCFHR